MVDGIIMVKTVRGHERRVHSMLRSLPGIKAMYILFGGDFDILMDAQVEGLLALNGLIEEVREMEGVVTTRTILAYDLEWCGWERGPAEFGAPTSLIVAIRQEPVDISNGK